MGRVKVRGIIAGSMGVIAGILLIVCLASIGWYYWSFESTDSDEGGEAGMDCGLSEAGFYLKGDGESMESEEEYEGDMETGDVFDFVKIFIIIALILGFIFGALAILAGVRLVPGWIPLLVGMITALMVITGPVYMIFALPNAMEDDFKIEDNDYYDDYRSNAVYAGNDTRQYDDSDGDGLSDYDEEYNYGTDPYDDDTDGDGYDDYDEVYYYGTDPNDYWDNPSSSYDDDTDDDYYDYYDSDDDYYDYYDDYDATTFVLLLMAGSEEGPYDSFWGSDNIGDDIKTSWGPGWCWYATGVMGVMLFAAAGMCGGIRRKKFERHGYAHPPHPGYGQPQRDPYEPPQPRTHDDLYGTPGPRRDIYDDPHGPPPRQDAYDDPYGAPPPRWGAYDDRDRHSSSSDNIPQTLAVFKCPGCGAAIMEAKCPYCGFIR